MARLACEGLSLRSMRAHGIAIVGIVHYYDRDSVPSSSRTELYGAMHHTLILRNLGYYALSVLRQDEMSPDEIKSLHECPDQYLAFCKLIVYSKGNIEFKAENSGGFSVRNVQ